MNYTYTRTTYSHPQQPEEFPFIILPLSVHSILWKTLKYWRITLLSFSVIFFFNGRHHIHKTDPSSTSETHLQQMVNSCFPEYVQTGTVVTIIYVHLDMLLFRRRGLPIGLFNLVSTLQTMEHPIPKSEDNFWRNSRLRTSHTNADLSEGLQPTKRNNAGAMRKF